MQKKIEMSISKPLKYCKKYCKNSIGWLVLIFCGACTSIDSITGLPVGENIIIPFDESIADWQEFTLDDGRYQFTLWQSPQQGFADSYSLSVGYDEVKTSTEMTEFRELMDAAGKSQCDNYSSKEIDYENSTSYPALFWLFDCQNIDGSKAKILHLIIQGNDNFYHLQKNWQYDFSESKVIKWQAQLAGTYVCNTQDDPPTCPIIR